MNLNEYQEKLVNFLIEERILLFGDFMTKSGRNTPYFINFGLCSSGYRMAFLSRIFAKHVEEVVREDFSVLFGPAYKGIPLCTGVAQALHLDHGRDVEFFYDRKEEKDHGEKGLIVGNRSLTKEDRVLLVDDVVTAGTSFREVRDLLKVCGGPEIVAVSVCVDRMEKIDGQISAIDAIRREGASVYPIIDIEQLVFYAKTKGLVTKEIEDKIEAYWAKYLVSRG